jgi:uncharacterized membrane protein YsdA (DUF1294 family)
LQLVKPITNANPADAATVARDGSVSGTPSAAGRLTGTIVQWDREKGFGYVRSGDIRIFLHRRDLTGIILRAKIGDKISFEPATDAKNRHFAAKAVIRPRFRWLRLLRLPILLPLLFFPALAIAVAFPVRYWPAIMIAALLVNLATWMIYSDDKKRAQSREWRTSESTLHILELLGGWPTAFLAQGFLRHKCGKATYQFAFWLIIAAYQLVALDCLFDWPLLGSLFNLHKFAR